MRIKVCPLCNALNVEQNDSCFACGWAGKMGIEDAQRLHREASRRLGVRNVPDPDLQRMAEIKRIVEKGE